MTTLCSHGKALEQKCTNCTQEGLKNVVHSRKMYDIELICFTLEQQGWWEAAKFLRKEFE